MKPSLSTMVAVLALLALASGADAAGDPQAGKAKVAACTGCHGVNGEGVAPNPPLAGKGEAELLQALQDYKSGKRDNPVMKAFAVQLSDQDAANVAAYYASLKK